MVTIRRLAIIGICSFVASCSSGGTPFSVSPHPTATNTAYVAPTPTLTPIAATTLWPHLQVRRISDTINANEHIIFQGNGTPDGRFLLTKVQTRYLPGYGPDIPEQVALYDTTSGALRVIASAHDNQHGVTGFVADNHWVAWYERGLPGISADQSWTLYVYSLDTGTIQQIAHNSEGGVYPTPQIDQGKLVWDEVTGGQVTLDRANFVIRYRDLATGATQILAQRAGNPVISWPWVGWSQVTSTDNNGVQGVEQFKNLETGEQATIQVMAYDKVLVGTSLVYMDNNDGSETFIYVPDIRHPDAGVQTYQPSINTSNGLTFNGRYIGWNSLADHEPPAIYDVQRHQAILLPLQYRPVGTETTFVIETTLVWLEDPNSDNDEATKYPSQHLNPPVIYSIASLQGL